MYLVIHLDSRFAVLTEWHLRSQAKERSWVQSCIYVNIYIYSVCVYVHMHLYKSRFKNICICKYPLAHTHISLHYFIYYTNVDHLYIELCIFAQGVPSQPGEPVDSQPLAALELAFFENSRSNVWLCNPTYI